MDDQSKKTALRMIPYGLYVLCTKDGDKGGAGASTGVRQAWFKPPLVAMGIKADTDTFQNLKKGGAFALSILGTGQKDTAFAFFKPTEHAGDTINGHRYESAGNGAPLLVDAPAWVEGQVTDVIERGDHAVVIGEVTEAGVRRESPVLTLSECGVFYGG